MAAKGETEYKRIGEKLAAEESGVKQSQMFGMPCLKTGTKAFAGYLEGAMIFKLTGEEHAEALSLKGAYLFDPMGTGRVMKEWVQVPDAQSGTWEAFARAAAEYVASNAGTSKPKAKKKKA
jgi:hypothetical protein